MRQAPPGGPDQWYRGPLPFVPNAPAGHLPPGEYHGSMTAIGRRELPVMEPPGSMGAPARDAPGAGEEPGPPRDALGRGLHDLRISVTDRCTFRCVYCMPKEVFGKDFAFLPKDQVLTFEEIERAARIFVGLGVEKLRITGGEPLIRRDLPALIERLATIRTPHGGPVDLTLTTNGAALRSLAQPLRDAGLQRITVSLDSLDPEVFGAMNGVDFPVTKVLDGISAARDAGLMPIKINTVIRRDLNDASILPMARWARDEGLILRFIEYMDVGHSNGWRMDDVVPEAEILARIDAEMPLELLPPNYAGEVATRWRYLDGSGEVGVIASVSEPFCSSCTRARLSAEGKLYTCLFAVAGHDLRALLRGDRTDDEIETAIRRVWRVRDDRYSDLRTEATTDLPKVEMFAMGG
jgi:cyclic pyranopterin phosphate synthase